MGRLALSAGCYYLGMRRLDIYSLLDDNYGSLGRRKGSEVNRTRKRKQGDFKSEVQTNTPVRRTSFVYLTHVPMYLTVYIIITITNCVILCAPRFFIADLGLGGWVSGVHTPYRHKCSYRYDNHIRDIVFDGLPSRCAIYVPGRVARVSLTHQLLSSLV